MVKRRLRVAVIMGGRSGEHEVSLMSAHSVLAALDPKKYEVIQIGITHDGAWLTGKDVLGAFEKGVLSGLSPVALLPEPRGGRLDRIQRVDQKELLELLAEVDVVFPVLHGSFGEDGTLQGLLEMADLAYVGAGVLGSALGMDKGLFKVVMRSHHIPVPDWIVVTRHEIRTEMDVVIEKASQLAEYPLFVKPANLGSSVGVSRCASRSDLVEGLLDAARFDRRILVERGIPKPRELEVSVLGNDSPRASVVGEVIPSREFYSYESKYVDGTSKLIIPAPIPTNVAQSVQDYAVRAYRAIDCAGMARVDFLLERESDVYLNELNTIPGFTQISMYPKLWEASGLSYPRLVDELIGLAMERKKERDHTERRYRRSG